MAQTRRFVVFPAALRRLSTRACLIGLIIVFGTAPAHCAVLSMQEFLSRRAKWETYANKSRPTNLILEGRYSSSAGASFRLQKCDVIFQPKRGVKLPVVRDKETRLEVSGHLKRVAARYVFVVERMRERTSHRDMLADARTRMEKSDPERWIELGQSNVAISEFYGDEKLLKATQTLFREAIARKREQLKPATESALRALATRAVKLGLPQETAEEFIHDALWIRWNQDRKNDKADLRKLLQQVATDFPSAKNPLQEFNRISSQAYLRQPAFLFARSNSKQRKTLQRYFYMHINEFIINKGLKPDYSNGFEIARKYEKEIPERSDLAESLRVKELAWREQSINRLSKNEMRQLARMHTDRGDANKARGVLETWFTFHDARLRKQGPAGLITLGDDYLNELHDKDKATAAFKEAWTYLQEPSLAVDREQVESKLLKLGWQPNNGKWVRASNESKRPELVIGNIQIGMKPADVFRILGSPTQKTRIASRQSVSEVWLYSDAGLSVVVKRPQGGTAKVIAVSGAPNL